MVTQLHHVNVTVPPELEAATKGRLDGCLIHLAVTLCRVAVANLEERPRDEHGYIERRASDKFFVVKIARVPAWRVTADPADLRRWCHTHTAEEWL